MALKNNEIIPVFAARSGQGGLDNDAFGRLIHEGSTVSTQPTQWPGFHQFEHIVGGFYDDFEIDFAIVGSGVGAVSTNGGLAFSSFRRSQNDNFSGNTEAKFTGSQAIASIIELQGVPTVGISSPFEALDAVLEYDPARGTGSPLAWPESRNIDLDTKVTSGSIVKSHGATSRIRVLSGATADNHTGFLSVGYNGAETQDSDGDIGDYIGFHAGFDPRITAPINGTMTNYLGAKIDIPDVNQNVTNDPEAIWINGQFESFASEIPFGLILGENKEDKIYHSQTFSGNHRLTLETSAIEFKDNTAGGLLNDIGIATEPVPVLQKLPTGSTGLNNMQWIQILLGSNIFYLPMFARN